MLAHQIRIPDKLLPLFVTNTQYDAIGSHGGRGSAKTRTFATMLCFKALDFAGRGINGVILCCREFMKSLEDSSMQELKDAIAGDAILSANFEVGEKFIRTKCKRIRFIFSGLKVNLNSIKSKSNILICWIDEAESVSEQAWLKLLPTLRAEGEGYSSQLWITWNPEREDAPIELRFRRIKPNPLIKIIEMNWRDNPWFPKRLERERLRDKENLPPAIYNWIWEGDYLRDDGRSFFKEEMLLVDGLPVPIPANVSYVLAVLDTAQKAQKENDGTAVIYVGVIISPEMRAVILDYDLFKIQSNFLNIKMFEICEKLKDWHITCNAQYNAAIYIPDTDSGITLLQNAQLKTQDWHYYAVPIPDAFVRMGKNAGMLQASPYVWAGKIKISDHAYNKTIQYDYPSDPVNTPPKNHLIYQITRFKYGIDNKHDDLADTFREAVQIIFVQLNEMNYE